MVRNREISYLIDKELPKDEIGNNHKTLEQQVYETIKSKIIYRELKPGERIIDKHLAEEMDVSRSLVRQAFNVLEKEGLITSIPRSGYYVREITKRDVKEIYNIRKLLETYATELSVPVIPEQDITEVNKLFKKAKKDLAEEKTDSMKNADFRLHEILYNNCKNRHLINMINKYQNHYIFYRLADLSNIERAKEEYIKHSKIFEAVKDRDVELAVRLVGEHIEEARDIIINNFENYTYGD